MSDHRAAHSAAGTTGSSYETTATGSTGATGTTGVGLRQHPVYQCRTSRLQSRQQDGPPCRQWPQPVRHGFHYRYYHRRWEVPKTTLALRTLARTAPTWLTKSILVLTLIWKTAPVTRRWVPTAAPRLGTATIPSAVVMPSRLLALTTPTLPTSSTLASTLT